MALFFGAKKQDYLGVDLGAGGIKLVELRGEKGRARLVTYGFTERLPDAQPPNLVDAPKETAALLRRVAQQARATTMRAVAGLPIASVFSAVITVPRGSDKELREAVEWQARKLIPVPLEEMVLDYRPVSPQAPEQKGAKGQDAGSAGKTMQVLLTGAAKSMVQKYVAVFREAGLQIVSLETEAFALIRSLIGKDRAPTMLVDVGAERTNIVVVEDGIPYVTRSLDAGGAEFTKAMSTSMRVDLAAAEAMKRDIRAGEPGGGDAATTLAPVFLASIRPLVTELRYSMELYVGAGEENVAEKNIEKIVMTGGGSATPGLTAHVAKELGVKAYAGDPWARVVYPDALRPVLDDIGYRYAVAVGLAMRDIE